MRVVDTKISWNARILKLETLWCCCFMRDSNHTHTPHRINSHSVAVALETLHMQGACGVNGSRTGCSNNTKHCAQ